MNHNKFGYLVFGIVLGFGLGFLFAKATMSPRGGEAPPAASASTKPAPPLSPEAGPTLPSNHPPIEETKAPVDSLGNTKDMQAAIAESVEIAKTNPNDYQAQMKTAALCSIAKRYDEAIYYLIRAQNLRPADFDAASGLGLVHSQAGKFLDAEIWLKKALSLNQGDVDCRGEYAFVLAELKKYDQALAEANRALGTDPGHARALEAVVKSNIGKGKPAEAEQALAKLVRVDSSNPRLAEYGNALEKSRKTPVVPSH